MPKESVNRTLRTTGWAPQTLILDQIWCLRSELWIGHGYNVTDLRSNTGTWGALTNRTTQRAEGGMDERHQVSFSAVSWHTDTQPVGDKLIIHYGLRWYLVYSFTTKRIALKPYRSLTDWRHTRYDRRLVPSGHALKKLNHLSRLLPFLPL